ncbi:3-deoxy-D-manno-octulosonic acid transferase [Curtobacterium sp. MCBA15_016]|uniref:DUF3800 domain-containing protein n=1 Tax=Curtobacterium sp. MCBA15_016 TaxID=1898740 RepID=UPI0008DDDADC|nr:DUF3800 domain-containing protein [Curtobacterium sp. MCBA15_016]OII18177.1 3-deoxy-D-manno-octulosonic acid transferase [Curtobacterium sp. MCBA15_016]
MRSGYVVYVDESGDHSLTSIDPDYPMFVLAFCIFPVDLYVERIVPLVQRIKFDFFNHDMVVLHEREMRQSAPPFDILLNAKVRTAFMQRVDSVFDERFGIVASAIRKHEFRARVGVDTSPYHVALEFGLERVFLQLQSKGVARSETVVVFESRGRTEDRDLEREFGRILSTTKMRGMAETFRFAIASKQANSTGLQIADLVARPIGTHLLHPEQRNRAWDRILNRMPKSPAGSELGWGLKVYP